MYVETRLENWDDIFKLYNRFLMAFVFRGHGSTNWTMSSALERMVRRFHAKHSQSNIASTANGYEEDMLKEFKWKYPCYEKINIPADIEVIEWLSIMQHYGAPTRMVDFSYSLYVALFMAMDSLVANEDSAVWCLNHLVCRNWFFEGRKELERKCRDKDEMDSIIYSEANKVLNKISDNHNRKNTKGVFIVKPHMANERIVRQQGLFAIQSDPNSTFEENLFSVASNKEPIFKPFGEIIDYSYSSHTGRPNDFALIKIIVPKEFRWNIFKSLEQMNISAEMMYPGLEGLARSMNKMLYHIS